MRAISSMFNGIVGTYENFVSNHPMRFLAPTPTQDTKWLLLGSTALMGAGFWLDRTTEGLWTLAGYGLLLVGKAAAYRAMRAHYPVSFTNPTKFTESPIRWAVDLVETTSRNLPHPQLLAAPQLRAGTKAAVAFGIAALGVAVDMNSTGWASTAGQLTSIVAGYFSYRYYRAMTPYSGETSQTPKMS